MLFNFHFKNQKLDVIEKLRIFAGLNRTHIYNRDVLVQALESRPSGVPLLTVANHHSCADEPLLWGKFD
jgi:hypothetical protein